MKVSSSVCQLIIRVSDQLKAGEISLIESTPEESKAAKARLDAHRKKRFLFFPSNELEYFEKALLNISLGKNPSGWVLTKPSEKDKGIEVQPISDNCFYTHDNERFIRQMSTGKPFGDDVDR